MDLDAKEEGSHGYRGHMAKEEGFAARRARTSNQADAVRSAAGALGIELFPQVNEHSHYSNTVTAMKMPASMTDDKLRGGMKKQGVIVSGGRGTAQRQDIQNWHHGRLFFWRYNENHSSIRVGAC